MDQIAVRKAVSRIEPDDGVPCVAKPRLILDDEPHNLTSMDSGADSQAICGFR